MENGDVLKLEAVNENLEKVIDFVDAHLENSGCSGKVRNYIELSVEEIFVNIASYAYRPGVGPVTVRVETDRDNPSVTIEFADSGVPYNPLEKTDPDVSATADERAIGGLGIFLVKKTMDNVEYSFRDGQNILRISKKLD